MLRKSKTVKRQASAESLASTGFFRRTTKVNDKLVSIDAVFKSLSDHKTLVLFDTIAHSDSDMDSLISNLEFTKKQYYSRIHSLTNSGLITRQN